MRGRRSLMARLSALALAFALASSPALGRCDGPESGFSKAG